MFPSWLHQTATRSFWRTRSSTSVLTAALSYQDETDGEIKHLRYVSTKNTKQSSHVFKPRSLSGLCGYWILCGRWRTVRHMAQRVLTLRSFGPIWCESPGPHPRSDSVARSNRLLRETSGADQWNHLKTDFTGPFHWFTSSDWADRTTESESGLGFKGSKF